MNDMPVVEVSGAVKHFGSVTALSGLDLRVQAGSVHGFLGPNGAGKTTTLRALLGAIRLDAGQARLFGADAWTQDAARRAGVAYVPGEVALWPSLTGGEVIDLVCALRGGVPRSRVVTLQDAFELDPTRRCRTYSKGNRQKVALVAVLAGQAPLLLLDEPTSGLDPLMEEVFRDQVRVARDEGRTVLLSSHLLDQVQALCDHVSIVRAGRTVDSGTLSDLRHLQRTSVIASGVPDDVLAGVSGIHDCTASAGTLRCSADAAAVPEVLRRLGAAGATDVSLTPASLEQLFLEHYRDTDRTPQGAR